MAEERTDPYETKPAQETAGVGSVVGASEIPTTPAMRRLASWVMDQFRVNRDHRQLSGVDAMLQYAANANGMKYSPAQMAVLAESHIDPRNFRPVTAMKVRSARAMLNDIIRQSGDKPYVLSPTPRPDVPESVGKKVMAQIAQEIIGFFQKNGGAIQSEDEEALFYQVVIERVNQMFDDIRHGEMEYAKTCCERMDKVIHDQLVEGGFIEAFHRFVGYLTLYGTALMVGPVPRVVARCGCRERNTSAGPVVKYEREFVEIPTYEAVSPWDCYPAPNAKRVDEGALCIKVRYVANDLWRYAEAETKSKKNGRTQGWQSDTVRALLSQYPSGGLKLDQETYDVARAEAEKDHLSGDRSCILEGVRCFASVRGSELVGFGLLKTPSGEKVEVSKYYKAETIVIGGFVVFCRIIDERMGMPVAKACLYETPDSWWGQTIAELLYSAQSMENNALKNIMMNGALASTGMFYCTDVNRVVKLDDSPALSVRAGKMFGFRASVIGNTGAPIGVLQVPDNTDRQIQVLKFAAQLADDDSGIPQYTVGSSASIGSGAGRTASGLSMMQESACRVINMCVCDIGLNMIVPMVRNTYVYNLLNSDDMTIKGDVEVNPSGLMGRILKEAESQRRLQMMNALGQHPILSKALTVEAFFELLRPELDSLGVNPDKIIPSKERMEICQKLLDMAQMQQAAMAQQQAQEQQANGAEPTPEQANVARVEGQPGQVAMTQGAPAAGTVAERRNAA